MCIQHYLAQICGGIFHALSLISLAPVSPAKILQRCKRKERKVCGSLHGPFVSYCVDLRAVCVRIRCLQRRCHFSIHPLAGPHRRYGCVASAASADQCDTERTHLGISASSGVTESEPGRMRKRGGCQKKKSIDARPSLLGCRAAAAQTGPAHFARLGLPPFSVLAATFPRVPPSRQALRTAVLNAAIARDRERPLPLGASGGCCTRSGYRFVPRSRL